MRRKYVLSGIIVMMVWLSTGCANTEPYPEKNMQTIPRLDYEMVYSFKSPYVGDAVNTSGLVRNLYYVDFLHDGIELQTSQEPYVLIAKYVVEHSENYATLEDHMFDNAAIIFSLIDNVDVVVLDFSDQTNGVVHSFERAYLEKLVGMNLSFFGKNENAFSNGLLPLLEEKRWSEEEQTVILNKVLEMYLWEGQEGEYAGQWLATLLPGTNRPKTEQEIYNYETAFLDVETINEVLIQNDSARRLHVRHQKTFPKDEVMEMTNQLSFRGQVITVGSIK